MNVERDYDLAGPLSRLWFLLGLLVLVLLFAFGQPAEAQGGNYCSTSTGTRTEATTLDPEASFLVMNEACPGTPGQQYERIEWASVLLLTGRVLVHDTDCTAATATSPALCIEIDESPPDLYMCELAAGGVCDTAGEWSLLVGGGGADGVGYDEVLEEGVGLTKRAQVNFVGSSVTCADNAGATRTDCTLTDDDTPDDDSEVPDAITISGGHINAASIDSDTIPAARVGADHIDAITEIASALKTGADAKLVTGTAGGLDNCAKWDVNGDLVDYGGACGTGGAHASTHEDGGGDEISVAGLSGVLAEPQPAKAARMVTDCTAETGGVSGEFCVDTDDEHLYSCQPTAGGCDTAGEWVLTGDGGGGGGNPFTSGGTTTNLSTSVTNYFPASGITASASTTEADVRTRLPSGTWTPTEILCQLSGSPGAGKSYTLTLRTTTGGDSDWSCVIADTNVNCSDTSGSALADTYISWSSVPSGTPTARRASCSIKF